MAKATQVAEDLHKVLENYQAHKVSQWEPYLQQCDKYYAGFRHNKTWPGTSEQRSNLKLHAAADMAETMYSSICHSLFYSGGENFFDVVSSSIEQAQNQTDRLRYLLHAPVDLSGRSSFWALKRGLRFIIRYGVGFNAIKYDKKLMRPKLLSISPYDLYWSPSTGGFIDESPKVFHRFFRTIEELDKLRALPGYHIPEIKVLKSLYAEGAEAIQNDADQAKRDAMEDQIEHSIGQQLVYEPGQEKLEIFRVTTSLHIYWLIVAGSRQELIYAAPNRLETQPYAAGFFRPLLEAFGGTSLIKLVSGEHEFQQVITNAMLDGIDLSITPPMRSQLVEKQHIWAPGKSFQGANEKTNVPVPAPPFPGEAFQAYLESRNRMFRIAGTNEMAVTGRASPGNANRTMGGMQLQDAAREQRAFGIIEEIESSLVVPALLKLSMLDRSTMAQDTPVSTLNGDKELKSLQPTDLPEDLHIEVRGATRMVGIARLSAIMEPMLQYVFNPSIQKEAMKVGQTLDFQQVDRFVNEAMGTDRKFKFFRASTQEEQQISQQGDLEKAQIQAQSRAQSDEMRSKTQLALEQMKQAGLSDERALKILELLASDSSQLSTLKTQTMQASQAQQAASAETKD